MILEGYKKYIDYEKIKSLEKDFRKTERLVKKYTKQYQEEQDIKKKKKLKILIDVNIKKMNNINEQIWQEKDTKYLFTREVDKVLSKPIVVLGKENNMSKVSKKINDIKVKLDSISGLDDDYVYSWVESIEKIVNPIVDICDTWSEESEEKGTVFYNRKINF